jgi:hypothetical protein
MSIFVTKIDISNDMFSSAIDDVKKSYVNNHPQIMSWISAESEYKEVLQIGNSFEFNCDAWAKYNNMKRGRFSEGNSLALEAVKKGDSKLVDLGDSVKRPEGTGVQYDHIDLSGFLIRKAQFIWQTFRFTIFTKCIIVSCDLSCVRFIGCNLNGVQFMKCTFKGNEVCFYKVIGKFSFCDCTMEFVHKKEVTKDPENIVYILKSRGLLSAEISTVGDIVMVSV